jgi:hypothetical protein
MIDVVIGGTIDRHNRCSSYGHDMFYHIDASGQADHMFCHNVDCIAWLKEVIIEHISMDRV